MVRAKHTAAHHAEPKNELYPMALVQAFEFSFELGWKLLKDYLEHQGFERVKTPREAVKLAFKAEVITDGQCWIDMLESRNLMAHSYNEEAAQEAVRLIVSRFQQGLAQLQSYLNAQRD
ncbi:MAG: HI0074 family nucleotidyltransferase substrate-binding subunit [bacterium]|nr:HI0074 family nucleotidyltransferase substrate-binding subunit [bacterium]